MTDLPTPESPPPVAPASPVKALLFAGFILVCVAVVYLTPLRDLVKGVHVDDFRRRVLGLGAWAPWAFLAFAAVGVAVGVPRLAIAALGGVLFGLIEGAALAQVGAFFGCWITFAVGRALGRDFIAATVRRRFPRAGALLDIIGRHGFAANVILRLAPVGNAFATSLLLAMSPVGTANFLLGTFLGTLPETVIFAAFGSAAGADQGGLRLTLGAASMAVLAVFVWWWTRRMSRRSGSDKTEAS